MKFNKHCQSTLQHLISTHLHHFIRRLSSEGHKRDLQSLRNDFRPHVGEEKRRKRMKKFSPRKLWNRRIIGNIWINICLYSTLSGSELNLWMSKTKKFLVLHLVFHLFRYAINENIFPLFSLFVAIGNCIKYIAQLHLTPMCSLNNVSFHGLFVQLLRNISTLWHCLNILSHEHESVCLKCRLPRSSNFVKLNGKIVNS